MISVIIAAHNEGAVIGRCLDALLSKFAADLDDDRRAGAGADAGMADGIGDRAGNVGEVVDPRGAAGLLDECGDRLAVDRPAGAGLERMRPLAPGTHHRRRPVG